MISAAAALAVAWLAAIAAEPASVLRSVAWRDASDTMRLEFRFAGSRPALYRVGNETDAGGRSNLRIEMRGVRLDSAFRGDVPGWFKGGTSGRDSGLAFRVSLERPVPWRAVWREDVLRLEFEDRIRRVPFWKNPWFLGSVGTGLVVGTAAIWVLAGDEEGSGDGRIPSPGFTFPE